MGLREHALVSHPTATAQPSVPVIAWDIDGTLLTGGDPDHIGGLSVALTEAAGQPVTLDGVALGGNVERRICIEALRLAGIGGEAHHGVEIDEIIDQAIALQDAAYRAAVTDRTHRRLPGVPEVLAALDQAGCRQGVATGGSRGVASHKLATAGLDGWITFGAFGCEVPDRETLLTVAAQRAGLGDNDRLIVIGDTVADVAAGRHVGARVIAVATGRTAAEKLRAAGADHVLDDLANVQAVVHVVVRCADLS